MPGELKFGVKINKNLNRQTMEDHMILILVIVLVATVLVFAGFVAGVRKSATGIARDIIEDWAMEKARNVVRRKKQARGYDNLDRHPVDEWMEERQIADSVVPGIYLCTEKDVLELRKIIEKHYGNYLK